jgi:hypothetical protein
MFYPEPEIEEDIEEQFYETYSRAVPRLASVSIYAQDGAGTPLGLAYSSMYNRFQPFIGFGNRYDYYNPYYYGGYYRDYNTYNLAGYTMYIPMTQGERKPRNWTRDTKSSGTNLITTRTRTTTNSSTNNSEHSNSSNVSVTRGTSSSSSSNNSSGRRVTKRN